MGHDRRESFRQRALREAKEATAEVVATAANANANAATAADKVALLEERINYLEDRLSLALEQIEELAAEKVASKKKTKANAESGGGE